MRLPSRTTRLCAQAGSLSSGACGVSTGWVPVKRCMQVVLSSEHTQVQGGAGAI